jgi:hypothetical protein
MLKMMIHYSFTTVVMVDHRKVNTMHTILNVLVNMYNVTGLTAFQRR